MRRVFGILTLLALAWVGGFFVFLSTIQAPDGGAEQARQKALSEGAQGVIVVTGAGGARLSTAMGLIDRGAGKRLLISGVNANITREEIAALWPGRRSDFDCCVDLGWQAQTTLENAAEARDWARDHEFASLILVTSDYHMPRALFEMRAALPDAAITPFAARSVFLDDRGHPASREAWRVLATEYMKYLAARFRAFIPRRAGPQT
ncbi:MAG: YdcF family protein [Pseudomonadota bacterium]